MNMAVGQKCKAKNECLLAIFINLFGNDTMPQSLSQLYAHLAFSTKDRFPFLKDDVRDRVHGYLATVLRDMGSPFVVVGGVEDHVHILFDMGRIHAAKDFVEHIITGIVQIC